MLGDRIIYTRRRLQRGRDESFEDMREMWLQCVQALAMQNNTHCPLYTFDPADQPTPFASLSLTEYHIKKESNV